MSELPRRLAPSFAAGLLAGALCGGGVVRATPRHTRDDGPVLVVPRAVGPIATDAELEDWPRAPARTGPFTTNGKPMRPYSDARFVVRDGALHVVLYAADEDIRTASDKFELVFHGAAGERTFAVSPRGVLVGGSRDRRARAAVDVDGIVDDPSDLDEEWVVEMEIPLDALGLRDRAGERVGLTLRRCDDVRGVGRTCGGWSGTLELAR